MRSHAKASTAGSTKRQAGRLGRFFRGAFVMRGNSLAFQGRGAPAARRVAPWVGVFAGLLVLMAFAIPASATKTHLFNETFGSAAQPAFSSAQGIAIDQSTGDVLVMDADGTSSIERYNPDGTPADFSALGTNVIDGQGAGDETPQGGLGFGGAGESQIAIDNSGGATDGNIYVTQGSPNLINIFSDEGEYLGQLSESSTGAFNEACGVAVDPSGAVYVGDYGNGIHKFVPVANPPVDADNTVTFSSVAQPCTLAAGAGPTAGSIFATTYSGPVSKLDAFTGAVAYVVSEGPSTTVSVDPATGHIYVVREGEVAEYDSSATSEATLLSRFSLNGQGQGVGVQGANGNVHVSLGGFTTLQVYGPLVAVPDVLTGSASNIGETTATLNGTVNPEGIELEECTFEYGPTASYGQTVPCVETPTQIGAGTNAEAVHADLSGLTFGGAYHFRLVAKNENDTVEGSDETFKALSTPVIPAQWAESVVVSEATLKAEINPEGFATTYHLEYGTDNSYGQKTAELNVGSDKVNHTVTAFLKGLAPGTTYHYRFVADNEIGPTEGADHTFTTYAPLAPDMSCANQGLRTGASTSLPDCRAYEMVSPVDKNNGDIAWFSETVGRPHALNQSSLSGAKITYTSYKAFGNALSAPIESQYLATRHDGDGWLTEAINPPEKGGTFEPIAGADREYKAFSPDLSTAWIFPESDFPLAPGAAQGHRNLYRRDNVAETYQTLTLGSQRPVQFQGSSKDGSHAIFTVYGSVESSERELYEWVSGELHLVSVLPDGSPATGEASAGRGYATGNGARDDNVIHAISEDGSRIFWELDKLALYLRQNPDQEQSALNGSGECTEPEKACTTLISQSTGSGVTPAFWFANPDGSRVFYTLGGSEYGKLYEYDVEAKTSTLVADEVRGTAGASDDTTSLYFVSKENLDAGATLGESNLYLRDADGITFVATLSGRDASQDPNAIHARPANRNSRVTPDGRHIVFMSERSLTGYDNVDSGNGKVAREIYRYDADSGQLSCISCNPAGVRPSGSRQMPVGPFDLFSEYFVAGWIAPWPNQFYGSRVLSNDGSRVFFNSFDSLVPQDGNGVQDVYEWEAAGAGSCGEDDPEFSELNDGCISLLSSGESAVESEFLDASTSGDDAFIRTQSSLLPQDPGLLDVYDVRVNGGFAQPAGSPACVGDACQSPPEARRDPTPASAGFHGAGNPLPRKASRRSCRVRRHKSGKGRSQMSSKHTKRCKSTKRGAGR